MSKPIIQVSGIGKKYQLGASKDQYLSLRDEIVRKVKSIGKSHKADNSFWALKDVSFDVEQGQTVGVIGRNGAGKSTLLKVLSQITPPTEGRIKLRGRVASLLEVGTGFHPELTGRENVYLNGAILGMSRKEVAQKFDEIVAFAEVEKFLDTPVKRYSSGMYVRLAFAVAAHLEPEILVVDEVLAVGDAEFQKKCLGKMGQVANAGRTILFVSHNMAAISSLCTKGVLMRKGTLEYAGDIETCLQKYRLQATSAGYEGADGYYDFSQRSRTDGLPFIHSMTIRDRNQVGTSSIEMGSPAYISIKVEGLAASAGADLSFMIRDQLGQRIATIDTHMTRPSNLGESRTAVEEFLLSIEELCLTPNLYVIDLSIYQRATDKNLDYVEGAGTLSVEGAAVYGPGGRSPSRQEGIMFLPGSWQMS